MAINRHLSIAYTDALNSQEPLASLRQFIAVELELNGGDRRAVLDQLEELRHVARREGQDEDIVLDVMDFVVGWCSPHMKIA